ncbi:MULTISPECIES: ferric reductase-like transmembrane domain-containing protein [unclassified Marinobacterium]|uniref:ferredoxin reductase family protein n=1 Tax=unclassified Marinobacterium TaxID=2644139 RepID=UPI0015686930|nr:MULTISPECIES: ferric reductase-like transmembrane domain-containing protein [unclassified Marinobacterium]NRP58278.1 NADH oxidoreductase hcr [Marinobacterium sp. xm-d-510]NRP97370.1 NADH oxidoreductase hcr [Marinobacterium sp. xm-a-127]
MKKGLLVGFYVQIIAIPLLASWYFVGHPRIFWQELGSVMAILAFAMILSEFVLSGPVKSFSRKVGMDATMRFHRIIGWCALIAALLHPFLYESTPTTGPWPWDSTRQFAVATDFAAISTGVIAFILLPVLVVLAVWRSLLDYRYETWRRLHGLIAATLVGLLLHHTLTAGRYAAHETVALLWQVMALTALLTLVYRYLISPIQQLGKPWKVSRVERLSEKQWRLSLLPDGHPRMDYKAGQFAWLKLGHSSFSISENPFSIASAPAEGPEICFVIKELGETKVGTRAYLDGPYGSLIVDGRSEPGVALIAGGVGVAPMLGILQQLKQTDDPRSYRLIYANRTEDQIVCRDELADDTPILLLSEPTEGWQGEVGFIDQKRIDQSFSIAEFYTWLFVICGPGPMMDQVYQALRERGVSEDRIMLERFNYD